MGMVTIHREGPFRAFFYSNEHEPAHVHIERDEGAAKIQLFGADGEPELIYAVAMKQSDIRGAMKIVRRNQNVFLQRWRFYFG